MGLNIFIPLLTNTPTLHCITMVTFVRIWYMRTEMAMHPIILQFIPMIYPLKQLIYPLSNIRNDTDNVIYWKPQTVQYYYISCAHRGNMVWMSLLRELKSPWEGFSVANKFEFEANFNIIEVPSSLKYNVPKKQCPLITVCPPIGISHEDRFTVEVFKLCLVYEKLAGKY